MGSDPSTLLFSSVISPVSLSNWQAEDAAPKVVSLEGKLPQHLKPLPTGPVSGEDHIRGRDHVTVAGRRGSSTAPHIHQLNHHGASLVLEIEFCPCLKFLFLFSPPVNTSSAANLWNRSKLPEDKSNNLHFHVCNNCGLEWRNWRTETQDNLKSTSNLLEHQPTTLRIMRPQT